MTSPGVLVAAATPAIPILLIGMGLVALVPLVYHFEPSFRLFVRRLWGLKDEFHAFDKVLAGIAAFVVGGIGAFAMAWSVVGIIDGRKLW